MLKKLTISIITVSFNSEATIEDTVLSLVNQTYSAIEYIVIDGGSSDETLNIINKYSDRLDRLVSEPDKGIYDAFNKGLALATGDVIYYLNSDDSLHDSTVIEDVMECFNGDQTLAFLVADVVKSDEEMDYKRLVSSNFTLDDIHKGSIPQFPTFFAAKYLYEKHGNYSLDYTISSDYEFMLKCYLSDYNNSLYLKRNISIFRQGGISTLPENERLLWQEKLSIMEKLLGKEQMEYYKSQTPKYFFEQYWKDNNLPLTQKLVDADIKKVAIVGTLEAAVYLYEDLCKAKIETIAFLDNDIRKHASSLEGVAIYSPSWLKDNATQLDAIIISVLHLDKGEIQSSLKDLAQPTQLPIYSYHQIVS